MKPGKLYISKSHDFISLDIIIWIKKDNDHRQLLFKAYECWFEGRGSLTKVWDGWQLDTKVSVFDMEEI